MKAKLLNKMTFREASKADKTIITKANTSIYQSTLTNNGCL
ncbi:MAG: hypothetical protein R2821_10440 [Flavobacteriaceae bacterium]